VLRVRNLTKTYRSAGEQINVLRAVNLDVAAGERVALSGESGSGKSTLLHLIAGLDAADSGEIQLGSDIISKLPDAGRAALRRDRLGLVFQQFNLIPSLTVADNLAFQSRIAGRHDAAWQAELAERLGLAGLLKRYPEQLSGGQQQRVAIARSLALQPQVMLFDEVTSALDPELTSEVLAVMEDLARRGMTMISVTHEMGFARRVADLVVFMHHGKVWETGPTAELFANPRTAEFKQFVGSEL